MAETTPPKMKKLPFKPTALRRAAAPTPTSSDDALKKKMEVDDLDLFRRSKEMAPIIAADRERRLRKQEQKKQKESEERRRVSGDKRRLEESEAEASEPVSGEVGEPSTQTSAPSDDVVTVKDDSFNELATPPPSKRSRIESPSKTLPRTPSRSSTQNSPSTSRLRSHTKPTTPKNLSNLPPNNTQNTPVILLDSDDDDDVIPSKPATTRTREDSLDIFEATPPRPTKPEPQKEEAVEENDEFAGYIRKAEEERKRAALSEQDGSVAKGPIVEILVTSHLEGAKYCCIKYFLDKPLLSVVKAWMGLQEKHDIQVPVSQSALILTWRGMKVYQYSTLHSLGIKPYGDVFVADGNSRDGISQDGTQIHMEIWTPQMFQEWEENKDKQQKIEAGELSEEEPDQPPEEAPTKLKIILKARDTDPVKLTVLLETTVETLVTAFRDVKKMGANKVVSLWFDGDKLEEHVTMQDADIYDMDTIDVHIE